MMKKSDRILFGAVTAVCIIIIPLISRADFEADRQREIALFSQLMATCDREQEESCASRSYNACGERLNWTTLGMQTCSSAQAEYWQAELAKVSRSIRRRSGGAFSKHMTDSQKIWESWRDSRCSSYSFFDGTMWRPVASDCWAETTYSRLNDLRTVLDAGPIAGDPLIMDIDCNGSPDTVFALPAFEKKIEIIFYPNDGDDRKQAVTLPVGQGDQTALCSPWLELQEVAADKGSCNKMRIDDGMCDAIYLSRDTKSAQWLIERN